MVARRVQGTWITFAVESGHGDPGRGTSIAVDPVSGTIHIVYFVADTGDGKTTGLKYARSKGPSPASSSDFQISFLDTGAPPPPPCDGGCTAPAQCVNSLGQVQCRVPTNDCADSGASVCTSKQVCYSNGCVDVVLPAPDVNDLPIGVGLMPSISLRGSEQVACYYDRINKNLKAVLGDFTMSPPPMIIDGQDDAGNKFGNVGLGCSVAVAPNGTTIGIAYQNFTTGDLMLYEASDVNQGFFAANTVDPGLVDGTYALLGGSTSLAYDATGAPRITYEDATNNDLKYATRRTDGTWAIETLLQTGAYGFWASQTLDATNSYISNLLIGWAGNPPRKIDRIVVKVKPLQ